LTIGHVREHLDVVRDTRGQGQTREIFEGRRRHGLGEVPPVPLAALAPAYCPHRPTETALYRVVSEHLETFLAHARETYSKPPPRYVEEELRAYLDCGIFARGFTRCHCDACGHDLLVAFSCKRRGVCPSCAGRRMANTAAHLVDRVLPDVPMRQFVLSLPYELRLLAAFKPDVLRALARIFVDAVFASYRARAGRDGIEASRCGAITFVQRFGGSLNLNVHFHTDFLDGVFTRDERGHVQFHPAPAPDANELGAIARRVHDRAVAWLGRRGHIDERLLEERSNESPERGAIEACAAIAMQRGAFLKLAVEHDHGAHLGREGEPPELRFAAEHQGFDLHAGVRIAAGDDLGRERLCRYGARPALALDRLRRLADGRIAYRVKYARAGAAKHRVMTGIELLARLCAIIPPPRFPLVRFHGVLAPRSSWRREVAPRPRAAPSRCDGIAPRARHGPHGRAKTPARTPAPPLRGTQRTRGAPGLVPGGMGESAAPALIAARSPPGSGDVICLAPDMLAVRHWQRLRDGALLAASPYVDWATLMRRSFDVDVLACARCGGRLHLLAVITETESVRRLLAHLGLSSDAPPLARARDPTDDAIDVTCED
jgi:hypothetical protein